MRVLASIKSADGNRITIGIGQICGDKKRWLIASNGDDIHPDFRPYPPGKNGFIQAITDIEAMWGRDWDLQWIEKDRFIS